MSEYIVTLSITEKDDTSNSLERLRLKMLNGRTRTAQSVLEFLGFTDTVKRYEVLAFEDEDDKSFSITLEGF